MPALDAVEQVELALQAALQSAVTGLTVRNEWPKANEQLVYPCLTILAGECPLGQWVPYESARSALDTPVAGQITSYECYGQYELSFQLDLWCATKRQRSDTLAAIIAALNPSPPLAGLASASPASGLTLTLTNYFNETVNFAVTSQRYVDDEAAAQRQERRALIKLQGNLRAIRSRVYYTIQHVEIDAAIGENVDGTVDPNAPAAGTEVIAIF